jgi:hypothetical protein
LGLEAMTGNGMVTSLAGSLKVSLVMGGGTYLRGTMVVQDVSVPKVKSKKHKDFIDILFVADLFFSRTLPVFWGIFKP